MYRQHYLLAFGGTLYGSEIWSCGLRLARPVEAGTPDFSEEKIDDMLNDLRSFMNSAVFNTQTVLTYVKLNRIGEDGRYLDKSKTTARYLSGTSGDLATARGTSSTFVPPQLTLAVTLYTDKDRGPGSKGRIFLPAPVVCGAVAPDGRLAAGDVSPVSSIGLQVGSLLDNLNNDPGFDPADAPRVVVATPGGIGMPNGDNVPVTGVGIGRVVDTMRSRRNALLEQPSIRVL
jgi:hypothetical protein